MSESDHDKMQTDALNFQFAHLGINAEGEESALDIAHSLKSLFGLPMKIGNSSIFSSSSIEIMKQTGLGRNGHIAISTANINDAIVYLGNRNIQLIPETYKYKNGQLVAAYLDLDLGGFSIHLLQRSK